MNAKEVVQNIISEIEKNKGWLSEIDGAVGDAFYHAFKTADGGKGCDERGHSGRNVRCRRDHRKAGNSK